MTQPTSMGACTELQQAVGRRAMLRQRLKPWLAAVGCLFLFACSQFSNLLQSDKPIPPAQVAVAPSQPTDTGVGASPVSGTCADCSANVAPTTAPILRGEAVAAPTPSPGATNVPMPPPSESTDATVADGAKPYFINIGAFAVEANASNAYQKVLAAGIAVFTQQIDTPKGRLTRVRAGPFSTRSDADTVAKRIRTLELDAVVMR